MSESGSVYVSFSARVEARSAERLLDVCSRLASNGAREVTLLLSTPGGSVMNGFALYNTLRAMPFRLATHNVGAVNSVGNMVFLAGEKRSACPTSTFMFHGVGFDVKASSRFDERTLREKLDSVTSDQRRIGAVISERTRLQADEIEGLFLSAVTRDARWALEKGLVHEVCDLSIPDGSKIEQIVFS